MRADASVYLCLREDGCRKLGWAAYPERRRKELQRQYRMAHQFEAVWDFNEVAARCVEMHAHAILKPLRCKGYREVYKASRRTIIRAVEDAAKSVSEYFTLNPLETPPWAGSFGWNRSRLTDEQVLETRHMMKADAARRIGMSQAGYTKRLQAALRRRTPSMGTISTECEPL